MRVSRRARVWRLLGLGMWLILTGCRSAVKDFYLPLTEGPMCTGGGGGNSDESAGSGGTAGHGTAGEGGCPGE